MKKLITIAALSATLASQTFAGDREWATVGKVLTIPPSCGIPPVV